MTKPPPLYQQIAEALRTEIDEGVYEPGQQLPPLRKLAAEFGTSTHPVRRAIGQLMLEARVVVIHGDATYVTIPPGT